MIYTITFNPSIDYMVSVDNFKLGEVNRVTSEYILPGGKGINVSVVLNNLGLKSIALGFISGFTGEEIKNRLETEYGLKTDFVNVNNGYSRINFKMKSHEESEVNGNGPVISSSNIQELKNKLHVLNKGDFLILSGSIPKSVNQSIYSDLMNELKEKEVEVVVDATGDLLLNVLDQKPFVIKPNNHELEEMFHVKLSSIDDIIKYAKKLQYMGAKNVLVSMAGEGALFICEDGNTYFCNAPKGIVKNSVGAGDSMVAGFVAGYVMKSDYIYAFKMGVSTGSASAFSESLATKEEVYKLLENVVISKY